MEHAERRMDRFLKDTIQLAQIRQTKKDVEIHLGNDGEDHLKISLPIQYNIRQASNYEGVYPPLKPPTIWCAEVRIDPIKIQGHGATQEAARQALTRNAQKFLRQWIVELAAQQQEEAP